MIEQPIPLQPNDVRVLLRCPLHFHFLQQSAPPPPVEPNFLVRDAIHRLHAAGGPARMSLRKCLAPAGGNRPAQQMLEVYYRRLRKDWPQVMAGNETMALQISIGGVSLALSATVDRLDKTRDGGILAIQIQTGPELPPEPAQFRADPATTIFHALVASTYPLKRPVRLQQLWLQANRDVTIELSEDEYRTSLSRLRRPVQALARGEIRARPGLHCDTCPFQHNGCPVYTRPHSGTQNEADDFDPPPPDGKISSRTWEFKI